MKRFTIYFLALAVLLTLAISCKKDDPAAPSVVGTWKFTSNVSTNCTDPGDNGTETCTGGVSDCGQLVLTASTYAYTPPTTGGTAENGTIVISGSTMTTTTSGGGSADVYTFTVTATTLTLVQVSSSSGCTNTTTLTKV